MMKLANNSPCIRTPLRNRSRSMIYVSVYTYSLETKLYHEKHSKTILDEERKVVHKKLVEVKTENQQMSR